MSKLQGDDALGFAVGLLMQRTEAMLKSMPAMLEATAVDALIIDPIQFYAELAPTNLEQRPTMKTFENKTVLITGGTSGIGKATRNPPWR